VTEPLPWRSDRHLDADVVRAVIRDQFPAVRADDVVFLHAGWDSEAYLVDDTWVFRFPKRKEVEAWLAREQAILPKLRPLLPLPIPEPSFAGVPGAGFPYHFMGYRMLPGTPADRLLPADPRHDADHARALGEFLTALHAFPVDAAKACGVAESLGDGETPAQLLAEARELAEWIEPALLFAHRAAALAFFHNPTPPPPDYSGEACLIHGDMLTEHVLIGSHGEICGIIDFGDIVAGDPAYDFMGLYDWRGERFVHRLLEHYSLPVDPGFLDRLVYLGKCRALIGIGHAARWGKEPMDIALAELAAAFGGP